MNTAAVGWRIVATCHQAFGEAKNLFRGQLRHVRVGGQSFHETHRLS